MKKLYHYFSLFEKLLWLFSVLCILIFFFIFDRNGYLSLIASLIGVTSLIFAAKGNPIGMVLIIIFSFLYGFISFTFHYYGEMITYLGMTMPMSVFSLISWLKNPFKGNKSEVTVNVIKRKEIGFLSVITLIVTILFYFILKAFHTENIIPSTISVTTTFVAVYLTFRRSPYYAIAYAMNDIVLIILWTMATIKDLSYLSVLVCFVVFLANDLYGFINWKRIEKRQAAA